MKKVIVALIALVAISNCCTYFLAYNNGYNNGSPTDNKEQDPGNDTWTKIDYPLIEYYFDDDSEWLIVITDLQNLSKNDGIFKIIKCPQDLRYCTQNLYVTTFPVGRGTTPNGEIIIYRNGDLAKRVQYLDYRITSQVIQDRIEEVNKEELRSLINADIPSPI